MCIVAVIDLVRAVGLDQDQIPEVKSQLSIRRALVPVGVTLVTLFLAIADEFIVFLFTDSFRRPGIWLGTFVTTLAFYPLREEKHADFKLWILFCAIMGVASVILSNGRDWLENVLI